MKRLTHRQRPATVLLACLAAFAVTIVATSCGGDEDYGPDEKPDYTPPEIPNAAPLPPETSLDCPDGSYLSFKNFGGAFLKNHCTSCHSAGLAESERAGAPPTANFDTAADAQLWRAKMLDKAVGADASMPPTKGVPDADKAAFKEWLSCGAPKG